MECPLNCGMMGLCKMEKGVPKCVCPPQYTGEHCEHYVCSEYCKNKGMCYVDYLSAKTPYSQAPLRCSCPPQWTGERCEIPVNVCSNRCFNGGTCYVLPPPGVPQCSCKPGFTGLRYVLIVLFYQTHMHVKDLLIR